MSNPQRDTAIIELAGLCRRMDSETRASDDCHGVFLSIAQMSFPYGMLPGLSEETLCHHSGLPSDKVAVALDWLKRHKFVQVVDGRWRPYRASLSELQSEIDAFVDMVRRGSVQ